jgi:hypothetical protein
VARTTWVIDTGPMPSQRPSPVSENSEEGRAFLRSRVALFWKVIFFIILLSSGLGAIAWITDRTGHTSSSMVYTYKRAARTHRERSLGPLDPLSHALPEMRALLDEETELGATTRATDPATAGNLTDDSTLLSDSYLASLVAPKKLQRLDSKRPPSEEKSKNGTNPGKSTRRSRKHFSRDSGASSALFSAVESGQRRRYRKTKEGYVAALVKEAKAHAMAGDEATTLNRLRRAAWELGAGPFRRQRGSNKQDGPAQ